MRLLVNQPGDLRFEAQILRFGQDLFFLLPGAILWKMFLKKKRTISRSCLRWREIKNEAKKHRPKPKPRKAA